MIDVPLNLLMRELLDPRPFWLRIRMKETERGHAIIQVGSVAWFPVSEWHTTDCITRATDGEVRIILISAKRPGNGAFKRLIDGLEEAGERYAIICPLPLMEDILRRRGWTSRIIGTTYEDREDQWRPPTRKVTT